METAARTTNDAHHQEQAPIAPLVPGPTVDTVNTTTATTNATATSDQSQTSPGYIQSARETLASIAGTVQNAIGIDTPASTLHSIADNAKVEASMPSSETSGAKPGEHTGGVGALPGSNKEEGIARLPAERMSVPSREHEGAHPGEKSSGVGALPGHLSENSVAVLPDERGTGHHASMPTREREGVHPGERSAGVGRLPGPLNESGVAVLPDERSTHTNTGVKESARAAANPSSEHPDKQDLKTAAAHPIETAKARRDSTSSSSSEGEQDPNAPKRKTKLRNKVAGGMKTAMGKIKKDEDLIAEGQAQRGH